ncbi:VTT domain-containing protein [Thalassotalea litorea]|uniref:TVP38/TMEM64 family membrane protein n=1 Tax=Thalassotalea litorea TaxID=2020715 RepID=A0A5R9IJI8_9GAMM|nr:VTT domain-containing protein [Thalassotalea litorea]TLU65714.1 VTT domain-containing protein [Thalassotalea litorea]
MYRHVLNRKKLKQWWLRHRLTIKLILGFLLLGILISAGIHYSGLSQYFNLNTLEQFRAQFAEDLALNFLLLMTLGTAIGLPRQICAFSAGYLFGAMSGIFLATTAAILGCLITILFAKYGLRSLLLPRYQLQVDKIHKLLAHQTFRKTLMVRFIPAGNNFLFNLCAGAAHVPLKPYLLGSYLGYIPQMSIFALMGSGIKMQSSAQFSVSIVLACIAVVIAWSLKSKQ